MAKKKGGLPKKLAKKKKRGGKKERGGQKKREVTKKREREREDSAQAANHTKRAKTLQTISAPKCAKDLNMAPEITVETYDNKQQTGAVTPICTQSIAIHPWLGHTLTKALQFDFNTRS